MYDGEARRKSLLETARDMLRARREGKELAEAHKNMAGSPRSRTSMRLRAIPAR